jgi:hypothetical protein
MLSLAVLIGCQGKEGNQLEELSFQNEGDEVIDNRVPAPQPIIPPSETPTSPGVSTSEYKEVNCSNVVEFNQELAAVHSVVYACFPIAHELDQNFLYIKDLKGHSRYTKRSDMSNYWINRIFPDYYYPFKLRFDVASLNTELSDRFWGVKLGASCQSGAEDRYWDISEQFITNKFGSWGSAGYNPNWNAQGSIRIGDKVCLRYSRNDQGYFSISNDSMKLYQMVPGYIVKDSNGRTGMMYRQIVKGVKWSYSTLTDWSACSEKPSSMSFGLAGTINNAGTSANPVLRFNAPFVLTAGYRKNSGNSIQSEFPCFQPGTSAEYGF